MKRLLTAIAVLMLFVPSAEANTRLWHPIYKAPPKPPTSKPSAVGGGGSFGAAGTIIYAWAAGCGIITQGVDTFIVHVIQNRRRNEADQLAAYACAPGQGHRFSHLFANKPRELYFYSEVNRKPAGQP